MRRVATPALGLLSIAALALTGCSATASASGSDAAADAPITIATLPLGRRPHAPRTRSRRSPP